MEFWSFVEQHVSRPFSVEEATPVLEAALVELAPEEIVQFSHDFDAQMHRAYTWDLWGVAYLLNGGCSDDAFMDFRASLIGLGQETFEQAVHEAESLLDLDEDQLEQLSDEGMLYVAANALQSVSKESAPSRHAGPTEPSGQAWQESREELMNRFPRAWAKYGWDEASAGAQSEQSAQPWWQRFNLRWGVTTVVRLIIAVAILFILIEAYADGPWKELEGF